MGIFGIQEMEKQFKESEIERNRKILDYLIKNPAQLVGIFETLERMNLLNSEHRVMIERFKQMTDIDVSHEAVVRTIKDFGSKAPLFFALIVSIAVYKFYRS